MSIEAGDHDVSVIILNHNTAKLTLDCLRSLYRETPSCRFEVIVVDNASSDGSPKRIRQTFPSAIVVESAENKGFAAGNNLGIRIARGRYVLLLNSDTIVMDGALDRLVSYLDSHPEVGVVGPRLVDMEGGLHLSARQFPSLRSELFESLHLHVLFPRSRLFGAQLLSWWDHGSERIVDFVEGSALLIRRCVIDRIGLLDEGYFMYSEDADWCWRVRQAGWQVSYLPEARVVHFGGASGHRRAPSLAVEAAKSKMRFFVTHYGEDSAGWLKLILLLACVVRLVRLVPLSLIPGRSNTSPIAMQVRGLRETVSYLFSQSRQLVNTSR